MSCNVSTVTDKNSQNFGRLRYLKQKCIHQNEKEVQLAKRRADKKKRSEETCEKKKQRLAKGRLSYNQQCLEKKQETLTKRRANYKMQRQSKTTQKAKNMLETQNANCSKECFQQSSNIGEEHVIYFLIQQSSNTGEGQITNCSVHGQDETTTKRRLSFKELCSEKNEETRKKQKPNNYYESHKESKSAQKTQERIQTKNPSYIKQCFQQCSNSEQGLLINSPIHDQKHAKNNMDMFHKANKYAVYQCCVCSEAWPVKTRPRSVAQYQCSRCSSDEGQPKRFSKCNNMIPSPVPPSLRA